MRVDAVRIVVHLIADLVDGLIEVNRTVRVHMMTRTTDYLQITRHSYEINDITENFKRVHDSNKAICLVSCFDAKFV